MKATFVGICLLLITFVLSTKAQHADTSLALPYLVKNSAIRHMELADSFSTVGDSINASHYYAAIDPYFFVSANRTPKTIDSSFSDYLLTGRTKDKYRKLFAACYNAERTEYFKTFKTMLDEDQAIRHKLSRCTDSAAHSLVAQEMSRIDSPHFEYLYNHVKKNGWPTYENGAMYAEVIAMHDGKHMQYYLPFIRKSVIQGNSGSKFYYNILNRAKPSNIEQLGRYKNKVSFDISYVLKGDKAKAAHLNEIEKVVKDCGPIKYQYYVYESANEQDFKNFLNMSKDQNYWLAWYILACISNAGRINGSTNRNVPYDFLYSKTENRAQKLTVYLMY